jgi:two-component system, OmpR family, sensor histidine kinase YxdK
MKFFLKEYKGYIFIYYLGLIITLVYCSMMKFIGLSEVLYILLFNTFILGCFMVYEYITTKKIYNIFENGINSLDKSLLDLGDSFLGQNVSTILNQQYELYVKNIQEHKRAHDDHLTFINHWIHQMKTPISVINLQLQDYEGEEIASDIQEELDRLNKGLNMAMYFARLDEFQKDFVIEKVNLCNEIMDIVNKEKRFFIKNRIMPRVDANKLLEVYTDAKWIKFVIEQVIINGVKYSKNYGKYLTIKSDEDNEYIKLDIIDEGIGISNKDIKRVFEPFFTGENGRKYGESTGMGLYIVKNVCDNLGHRIEIKSEINKGTRISILFEK